MMEGRGAPVENATLCHFPQRPLSHSRRATRLKGYQALELRRPLWNYVDRHQNFTHDRIVRTCKVERKVTAYAQLIDMEPPNAAKTN